MNIEEDTHKNCKGTFSNGFVSKLRITSTFINFKNNSTIEINEIMKK